MTEPRPTMATIAPRWRALTHKLIALAERDNELRAELDQVEYRLAHRPWTIMDSGPPVIADSGRPEFYNHDAVRSLQANPRAGVWAEPDPDKGILESEASEPPPKPLSDATRALLGELAPPPAAPRSKPASKLRFSCADAEHAYELKSERAVIADAIKALQPEITREHAKGSRALCGLLQNEYRQHAARICAAVVELGDAVLAHGEYTDSLVQDGCAYAFFRPVNLEHLDRPGDPRDAHSGFRRFLTLAAECGHFDLSSLPESWRPAPPPTAPEAQPAAPARRAARAVRHAVDTAAAYIVQGRGGGG